MPILITMLLIGLFAGMWGFLMCFFPARWDKLTEAMSFAGRWTEPSPKRLHPLLRLGNRIAGVAILAVGCWFAYMAAFPAKALAVFERVWPSERSVTPPAAPKVMLFMRFSGTFFAFLALMYLLQ